MNDTHNGARPSDIKYVPNFVLKNNSVRNNSKGKSKENNQKPIEEIKANKRAMNIRYKKNLIEKETILEEKGK